MSNFFSGTSDSEIAEMGRTEDSLKLTIEQFMSVEENVTTIKDILNSSRKPLAMQIALVFTIQAKIESLQEADVDEIYAALSRWVNKVSKRVAVEHKFQTFEKLMRGKVVQSTLSLEQKPQEANQAA